MWYNQYQKGRHTMEFAKLSAPSLKDLFVQQLQGMILSDRLPMGTSFRLSGNWPSRCR